MKPFEIQGAELVLGGVQLQAGNTGVVIPGVTRATSYRVEEVRDTADQDRTFAVDSEVVVVDGVLYNAIVNQTTEEIYADFTATTDDEGYIDEIEVNGRGTYTAEEAAYASSVDMFVYIGAGNASDRPLIPEDWVQIPFRPKMRAGEIEREGGGGGASSIYELDGVSIGEPSTGEALVFDGENWVNQTISGSTSGTHIEYYDEESEYTSTIDLSYDFQVDTKRSHANFNGAGDWDIGSNNYDTKIFSTDVLEEDPRDIVIRANNKDWTFDREGNLMLPQGGDILDSNGNSVLGGSSSGAQEYGYFNELVHAGDNNQVNGEAVAVDAGGNSYVSYSYFDNNDDRDYGGVMKFSSTGEKLWSIRILPQNSYARYIKISSLEFVTLGGEPALIALGNYQDYDVNKDIGFMYYINPSDGSVSNELIDAEVVSDNGVQITDGVVGLDENGAPFAVVVGSTYSELLLKTLTPLAGSTTDKLYFSWSEINASGVQNGEQLIYNNGGYWGVYVNVAQVTASPDGTGNGIYLSISATEGGTYNITRVNGWSGVISGWDVPVTLRVLGSSLGGEDGVNDFTFDFDRTVFADNSNNIDAAVSNKQGTPISNVYCSAWNGRDWSADIGTPLTFEYQLNNQACIFRLGNDTWVKDIGATSYDIIHSVAVDGSGNTYAVGNYSNGTRAGLVIKYDITGTQQWAVYIDSANNMQNEVYSIDLLSDGNLITVDEDGVVTKIDSSNGDILWQVTVDSGPSWDSDFRGTAAPNGNYIFTNYEDNDYTMYVMCISGTDGSSVWTKQISRFYNGSYGQIYPQNDFSAQYIDCNDTFITIAGSTEPPSGNRVGLVFSIPLDGQNVDGTYGQYVIASQTLDYTIETTTSVAATINSVDSSVSVNSISPTAQETTITVTKTSIGGDNSPTAEVISWTSPNNNVWRIETYNSGTAVTYYGGEDYSAKWFDIANHTGGASDFRGAIIQYHAFIQNRGTIIGTIHLSNDYTQQNATHTEHLSGDSDLQLVTLWDCNNERGQLFFKMTNNQTWDAMVQWTSTVFYGAENND